MWRSQISLLVYYIGVSDVKFFTRYFYVEIIDISIPYLIDVGVSNNKLI